MRSPVDDLFQPVTGCCTLLVLLLWCEHLDRAFLARAKQDHALQTPQAEWTNLIVEREKLFEFSGTDTVSQRAGKHSLMKSCYAECFRPAT
jgi:hypothetical protein